MACPICGGGGDQYYCDNELCVACGPVACEYCADAYDHQCPICYKPLHNTAGEYWRMNREEEDS